MGRRIDVSLAQNPLLVQRIMNDPDVFSGASDDGVTWGAYDPDMDRRGYLLCWVDDALVGCCIVSPLNSTTVEIHASFLKTYWGKTALDCFRTALSYLFETYPQYKKVVGFVPVVYRKVARFAVSAGFKREGLLTKSFKKSGNLHDLIVFGLSSEDFKG